MSKMTTTKEFLDPYKDFKWTSEGVAQEGAVQTIVYLDEDRGTYCRMLRFPEAFGEVTDDPTHSCCSHNFDELVFIASGGAINRRLDCRYYPGTIASFPAGINHGPLWTPFGALLVEFRHYRDEHLKGIKGEGETEKREFINPVSDLEWSSEGVAQEGAKQTIIYRDEDMGTYCRMLHLPEGFSEGKESYDHACCSHDFDEIVFIVTGGAINRRLGYRYHPGTIAVFPAGVDHGPLETPFGALLLEFRHYRKK